MLSCWMGSKIPLMKKDPLAFEKVRYQMSNQIVLNRRRLKDRIRILLSQGCKDNSIRAWATVNDLASWKNNLDIEDCRDPQKLEEALCRTQLEVPFKDGAAGLVGLGVPELILHPQTGQEIRVFDNICKSVSATWKLAPDISMPTYSESLTRILNDRHVSKKSIDKNKVIFRNNLWEKNQGEFVRWPGNYQNYTTPLVDRWIQENESREECWQRILSELISSDGSDSELVRDVMQRIDLKKVKKAMTTYDTIKKSDAFETRALLDRALAPYNSEQPYPGPLIG